MEQEKKQRKYLYAHTSPETAFVVDNYPWGFRLRTTIRYWIETKHSKNGGQRFGSQTINPKTREWCAPKYSTYSPVMVMFLNENDHVKVDCVGKYNNDQKILKEFLEIHFENLSKFQIDQLTELAAINEVMKNVKFTIKKCEFGQVSLFSKDPVDIEKRRLIAEKQEARKEEDDKNLKKINQAIAYEMSKIELKNALIKGV